MSIDREDMRFNKLDALYDFIVLRSSKFIHRLKKTVWFYTFVFKISAFFWWLFIFPLLIFFEVTKFTCLCVLNKKNKRQLQGDVIIALTHRVTDVVLRLPNDERPHSWLTVPWVSLQSKSIPEGDERISFLCMLKGEDIVGAMLDAWRSALAFAKKYPEPTNKLQTYTAYSWFLLWRVLSREGQAISSIWFANHYDRWAVLLDQLPLPAKRVMLQHGLARDIALPKLPTKIENLSTFYCFGETSRQLFYEAVFARGKSIVCKLLPGAIPLQNIPSTSGIKQKVLIIGEQIDPEKECLIAKEIVAFHSNVDVYIKPHPVCSTQIYKNIQDKRVTIIMDKDMFPRVDVALCTYSTLGLEYSASGVAVIWHAKLSVKEVVKQVGQYLTTASI
jgi:hypothetical protein